SFELCLCLNAGLTLGFDLGRDHLASALAFAFDVSAALSLAGELTVTGGFARLVRAGARTLAFTLRSGVELTATGAGTLAGRPSPKLARPGAVPVTVRAALTLAIAGRTAIELTGAFAGAGAFSARLELTRALTRTCAFKRGRLAGAADLTVAAGFGLSVDHTSAGAFDTRTAGLNHRTTA